MCGIAGFSGFDDRSLLEDMSAAMAHRGPDDSGIFFDTHNAIGLAHRRLSIIDVSSRGHQPMWDSTHSAAIAFNGEIYNFGALRRQLLEDGYAFNSRSDTEVILNLYLRDGEKMLESLNGIFAFALWDARNQTLLIARDGFGVKPLYYAATPRGTVFASEIKALLRDPTIDREIDPRSVRDHLIYLWCPAPRTMLRSVRKLPPGHAMQIRDGRVTRDWQFYDLPYGQELVDWPASDAVVQVRKHLTRAVKRQLVSDVPVGGFLSGGLDSSSVVALAQRQLSGKRLQCFTIGFKGKDARAEGMARDLHYAQRVSDHLGVDLHTVWVGPEMVDELPGMIFHLDEPQADPAPINALFISRLARDHGIKVLLSGAGGDDVFTGYRRHYALQLERYWAWLPAPVRSELRKLGERLSPANQWTRRFSKAFRYADLDSSERIESYFHWIAPSALDRVFSERIRAALAAEASTLVRDALASLPASLHPLNRMLYLDTRFFLADHNLNYVDKVSMASGVEVRVPMLDPELVALAARLPVHFKQRGRVGKWVLREAMKPHLPRDVLYREKAGFGAPLRHWLREDLRSLVEDVLSERSLRDRGIFDPAGVRELVALNNARRLDAAYPIFGMICIELWCRMFIDRPAPEMLVA